MATIVSPLMYPLSTFCTHHPPCAYLCFRRTRERAPGGNFWGRDKSSAATGSLYSRYVNAFNAAIDSAHVDPIRCV